MKLRSWGLLAGAMIVLIAVVAAVWTFGPREPADLTTRFDASAIGDDPAAYLARTEADVPNLRSDVEKEIVWAYPASRARTPIALVYVHGFSSSRNDLRPLPDSIARLLGANLFMTRLSGHGQNGEALAGTSVNDWWNDLAEAVAIGRRLGERVVVIGHSAGGTLAVLGASDPALSRNVAGLVLLAPNFGIAGWRNLALDMPFGREIGPQLFGEEWGTGSDDARITAVWTTRYPTVALLTMGALVRATLAIDLSAIKLPALFVYSPNDKVVDPAKIRAAFDEWGGPKEAVEVPETADPTGHIIAGDLLSPNTTDRLAERIAGWIGDLPRN